MAEDLPAAPANEATKRCPACAETIKAEALVCRHCSYNFGTGLVGHKSASPKVNGLAITSLVLGIVWIYGVGAILAIVFGIIARRQIDESQGQQGGRGMATAGLTLGIIGVAGTALIILLVLGSTTTSSTFCTGAGC